MMIWKEGDMKHFLARFSTNDVRWIARIFGTLLGLLLLGELIEWFTGEKRPSTTRDYLVAVGCVLIVSGFVVGWFKELAASLLVLGGTALVCVIMLLPPRQEWPWPIFIITAFLGLLFLNIHLAAKKG
jgi:hypothetical protein